MKYLKMLGLAAVAAMAMIAFTAGSASAAQLEVEGVAQSGEVSITASLKSGTSAQLKDTEGFAANTCTTSHVAGKTESGFTTAPTGSLSSLSFANCTRPVTVHAPGKLEVTHAGGTNGNVYSEEAQVTVGSPFGTLNCTTGSTTKIGTLTGGKEGHATIDVNAVIDCGFYIPTANWTATYTVTSPTGLGVTDSPPPPAPTTLEVAGTPKAEDVEITATMKSGTSALLADTENFSANTCTTSHVAGKTESGFTTAPTGSLSSLSFANCTRPVTVHKAGRLYVESIPGTTNGTVSSEEAEVTVSSPFGTLNCRTGGRTDLGTLTGGKEGHATLDVNAVINCGFFIPTANWTATYTVTSPTGLGVTDSPPPPSTKLEIGGVAQGGEVLITASLASGTSALLADTEGFAANTCTTSHVAGKTESGFTTAPTGSLSSLSFANCTRPVTVHAPGKLEVTHAGGTNGNVYSEEAQVTVGSPFGTLNCTTGSTTKIGTLTGGKEGHATIDVNAVIDCGLFIPTANWTATYTVTSPTGLGVTT